MKGYICRLFLKTYIELKIFLNCYRFFVHPFSCEEFQRPVQTLILIEHLYLSFIILSVRYVISSWVKAFFPPLQVQCGGGGRLWWPGPRRQRLEDHTHWCFQVSPLQKPSVCRAGSGSTIPYSCHRWAFIRKYTQTQQHTGEHQWTSMFWTEQQFWTLYRCCILIIVMPPHCHRNHCHGIAGNVQRTPPWRHQLRSHRSVRSDQLCVRLRVVQLLHADQWAALGVEHHPHLIALLRWELVYVQVYVSSSNVLPTMVSGIILYISIVFPRC